MHLTSETVEALVDQLSKLPTVGRKTAQRLAAFILKMPREEVVEIARALATRPSFMLLDEPFAGIDPLAIADIRDLIRFLKDRGIGILITDHNVRETLEITDRATIIYDGEVLFEGSPEEIRSDPDVKRVYLGESFS